MNCPVCNVELKMSERQGVEVDYCPKCRGVWLDRGELDKILERSAGTTAAVEAIPENRPSLRRRRTTDSNPRNTQNAHEEKNGLSSLLSDLFDF